MKILVINCGSSSLKYQLIDMDGEKVLCKGNCERIGIPGSLITHKTADGYEVKQECPFKDHTAAFAKLIEVMTTGEHPVIRDIKEINAIGHRIVQGADKFPVSCLVDEDVVEKIADLAELAPLHNPAHVQGIRAAQKAFGKELPQAVVFDTAFHQTMPPKAYMFAVPYEYYEKYHIRRYGAHGTSHRYVSKKCADVMGKPITDLRIVTCHLGNGSSITAVNRGKSVDTSMGLTPTGGVMMGTRSGDLDPSVVTQMAEISGKHGNELFVDVLNGKSGLLGISGVSSDNRDIEKAAAEGNERARLAQDMLCYQIKKYIGGYVAAMGGIDALVFTGGIGENSDSVRHKVCEDMDFFGIRIDEEKNKTRGDVVDLTAPGAKVRTFIICTNEELMIARDTKELVEARS